MAPQRERRPPEMKFPSAKAFMDWPAKAVTIFGMSGVGKTSLARMLRHHDWFHFSVDYRIGTRYMGEHIVDNFKKESVTADLKARGVTPKDEEGGAGFHIVDPDGYPVQISANM